MRGVLTDYGVGKMRFQLSDFTSIYSVHTWLISEWHQCSNSLVIMVLSLPFLVILISENLTSGFYMSQIMMRSDHSGSLCVLPKRISI